MIALSSEFKKINSPLNPHQFDYAAYLKGQNIYHQIYTLPATLFILKSKPTTAYGYADAFRIKINEKLREHMILDQMNSPSSMP